MDGLFVSRRSEIKYLVDTATLKAFDERVRRVLVLDRNNPEDRGYFNYTIYFDSPGYLYYMEKIEGLTRRVKPRLRVYKSVIDGPATNIFFEFKHRNESFVAKERVAISEATARALLTGQGLHEQPEICDSPVLRKLLYLTKRHDLRPSICVLYHRFAYVSPLHHRLRITYDRRLQCSEVIGLNTPPEAFSYIEPPTRSIIEIKYDGRCPGWLLSLVESLELERVSFSKYAASMERCLSRSLLPLP